MKITEFTKYREGNENISRIEERDLNNNITEEFDFDQEGQLLIKSTYKYNDKNKVIEIAQFDEDNNLIEKKTIEFDDNNKELSSIIEFPDASLTKESRIIDGNSTLIKTEDEDGEFEGSVEYISNNEDLVTEVIRTNFMNKVDSKVFYEYNDIKQNVKVIEKDGKGYFIKAYSFAYDKNNNKIREEELDKKDRILDRKIFNYDADLLSSIKSASDSVYYHYKNNNIIKEERLNPDSSSDIVISDYEGDKIKTEKLYSIPHGETIEEGFLSVSKRYIYE